MEKNSISNQKSNNDKNHKQQQKMFSNNTKPTAIKTKQRRTWKWKIGNKIKINMGMTFDMIVGIE